jgi:hypothetical protein
VDALPDRRHQLPLPEDSARTACNDLQRVERLGAKRNDSAIAPPQLGAVKVELKVGKSQRQPTTPRVTVEHLRNFRTSSATGWTADYAHLTPIHSVCCHDTEHDEISEEFQTVLNAFLRR